MNEPKRIQRKRTAGWKMPPNTKCVTRPGRFGNPFYVDPKLSRKAWNDQPMACGTAREAVLMFEGIVSADPILRALIVRELRGFNLACYCKPGEPCHADVLLRIANA